jgi:hypothetical protein
LFCHVKETYWICAGLSEQNFQRNLLKYKLKKVADFVP